MRTNPRPTLNGYRFLAQTEIRGLREMCGPWERSQKHFRQIRRFERVEKTEILCKFLGRPVHFRGQAKEAEKMRDVAGWGAQREELRAELLCIANGEQAWM